MIYIQTIILILVVVTTMFLPVMFSCRLQVYIDLGNLQEILNRTLYLIFNLRRLNKGLNSVIPVGFLDRYTPEEGRKAQRPKHCNNNNKDENNSLNVCSVN